MLKGVSGHGRRKGARKTGVRGWSRGTNDSPDPGHVFADIGVDGWVRGSTTGVNAPGEDAMQGVVTHQRATRVTLRTGERRHHEVRAATVWRAIAGLGHKRCWPGAGMMSQAGVVRGYRLGGDSGDVMSLQLES